MTSRASFAFVTSALGLLLLGSMPACGGFFDSVFGDGADEPSTGGPSDGFGGGGLGGGGGDGGKPCTNLCLKQQACSGGASTSIKGKVYDPAGKNPLYNVMVFVPNAKLEPIKEGADCDRCGSISGDPLVATITDAHGEFELKNLPVMDDMPLVVQVGKWRRVFTVPKVEACKQAPLPVAERELRLPRNRREGDIPRIAISTGGADTMECLLRKVGLEDSEFGTENGEQRVHLFAGGDQAPNGGNRSTKKFAGGVNGGASFAGSNELWSTVDDLKRYDLVVLSCEGDTRSDTKPAAALNAMHDYAKLGGRVFASHWHRYWFSTERGESSGAGPIASPFPAFATWADRSNPRNPSVADVNTSFPKGDAMAEWLVTTGASPEGRGKLSISEPRHNVDAVDGAKATSWINIPNGSGGRESNQYLSVNTPVEAADDQKCGRVVFSDLHVSAADQNGPDWPSGCRTTDLSPQEKALEFMLFDLSACVQSDKVAPSAPPVVPR